MSTKVMTHNQYDDFVKEQADILWSSIFEVTKGKDAAAKTTPSQDAKIKKIWDKFNFETDNVKIVSFDLSEYTAVPDEIKGWISAYFETEETDKNGHRTFKGFLSSDRLYVLADRLQLTSGHISYSGYYFSDDLQMTLSFAEGDLYLNIFNNKADYEKELSDLVEFYENN